MCKDNVQTICFFTIPPVPCGHIVLQEKFNCVGHLQLFKISPWKRTWKVITSRGVWLKTNYWHCNRATNWPNWQEFFNNELQIPDSLFSDRLAQTHSEGQAGTHIHTFMQSHTHTRHEVSKQSRSQSENVLGSTIQGKSNQIKLAECHIHQWCCCWQTAAGCYPSDKAFSETVLLAHMQCCVLSMVMYQS